MAAKKGTGYPKGLNDLLPMPRAARVLPYAIDYFQGDKIFFWSICDVRRSNIKEPKFSLCFLPERDELFAMSNNRTETLFIAKGVNGMNCDTFVNFGETCDSLGTIKTHLAPDGSVIIKLTCTDGEMKAVEDEQDGSYEIFKGSETASTTLKLSVTEPSIVTRFSGKFSLFEYALIMVFTIKIAHNHYKLTDWPFPVCVLNKHKREDIEVPRTTSTVLDFMFVTMLKARIRMSFYHETPPQKAHLLRMDGGIFFVFEMYDISKDNSRIQMHDRFGEKIMTGELLRFNYTITMGNAVTCVIRKKNIQSNQYSCQTKHPGDQTVFEDGQNRAIMYSSHKRLSDQEFPPRNADDWKLEFFEATVNRRVATTKFEKNTLIIEYNHDTTIPALYRAYIAMYAMRLMHVFFSKVFKNQLCHPDIGYVQPSESQAGDGTN